MNSREKNVTRAVKMKDRVFISLDTESTGLHRYTGKNRSPLHQMRSKDEKTLKSKFIERGLSES